MSDGGMEAGGRKRGVGGKGWFKVYREGVGGALQLPGGAVKIWLALRYFADDQTGRAFPSLATLAEMTHLDRSTVCRGCQVLRKAGLLEVVVNGRRGRSTVYRVGGVAPTPKPGEKLLHGCNRSVASTPADCCTDAARTRMSEQKPAASVGAAAADAHRGSGRARLVEQYGEALVADAEAALNRRVVKGERVENPGGLLRTMLREGFTRPATSKPLPDPFSKVAIEAKARIAVEERELARRAYAPGGPILEARKAAKGKRTAPGNGQLPAASVAQSVIDFSERLTAKRAGGQYGLAAETEVGETAAVGDGPPDTNGTPLRACVREGDTMEALP